MGWKAQAAFHLVALGFFTLVSYRIQINKKVSSDPTVRNMQRFSLRFLTNWTFTMQTVYFLLCVLGHAAGLLSARLRSKITKVTNYMAISITAPMSLVVSVAFWGIYLKDRELVFPKALDEVLPPFLNHSIHTFNAVLALIDLFLVRYNYPSSYLSPIKGLIVYLLAYSVCLFGTFFVDGIWLYPFLNKLSPPEIALATLGVLTISLISLFSVRLLHRLIWGAHVETQSKKHTKKKK